MSKAPFRFPLADGDMMTFCHPSPASGLDQPHFLDGDLHAGNGHIAVRARRGLWMESDYEKPSYEFTDRLASLPWHSFPDRESSEWRDIDDVRGDIYARGVIGVWTEDGKRSPSPVWRIAGTHLIRLSHLQLIARLPAVKVFAGPLTRSQPLMFRFNGGQVIVPIDKSLTTASWEIFAPTYDRFTGTREMRHKAIRPSYVPPPVPEAPIDNWPPAELD